MNVARVEMANVVARQQVKAPSNHKVQSVTRRYGLCLCRKTVKREGEIMGRTLQSDINIPDASMGIHWKQSEALRDRSCTPSKDRERIENRRNIRHIMSSISLSESNPSHSSSELNLSMPSSQPNRVCSSKDTTNIFLSEYLLPGDTSEDEPQFKSAKEKEV